MTDVKVGAGEREYFNGKIRKVDWPSGASSVIPFRVSDTRDLIDPPRPAIEVAPTRFETKMPRGPVTAPDGRTVLFETMGKLWVKPATGGAARRLTSADTGMEAYPTWSRDGKTIAYVHWTDKGLGNIHTISASGGTIAFTSSHHERGGRSRSAGARSGWRQATHST